MKVHVKCFANLASEGVCDHNQSKPVDVPGGTTVNSFLRFLGVAREAVWIAFVNKRIVPMDRTLKDGDRIALAPSVGGM
ncbi:MAG: MoaD/ThiS family protein [Desulfobacterales bacterium]|nr:MoaD/ThiS family protein [Desulfobacterales bacterium]